MTKKPFNELSSLKKPDRWTWDESGNFAVNQDGTKIMKPVPYVLTEEEDLTAPLSVLRNDPSNNTSN